MRWLYVGCVVCGVSWMILPGTECKSLPSWNPWPFIWFRGRLRIVPSTQVPGVDLGGRLHWTV